MHRGTQGYTGVCFGKQGCSEAHRQNPLSLAFSDFEDFKSERKNELCLEEPLVVRVSELSCRLWVFPFTHEAQA